MALTERQQQANELMAKHKHVLLYGGARSGKTWVILRAIVIRALKASGSTHAVLRLHFGDLRQSIILDTFPTMMQTEFPQLEGKWTLNKSDWHIIFPNQSRIVFGGLDDQKQTDKVLGQGHSTIFLNEASQISYASRSKAVSRLAQNKGVDQKEFIDCNPPSKGWWGYKIFIEGQFPDSEVRPDPSNYAYLSMNPTDNDHLPQDYIKEMLEPLPERQKKRLLHGEFSEDVDEPLWTQEMLDKIRCDTHPELDRIVIAVDPSGQSGDEDVRSDEVGIVVMGRANGCAYLLEDASGSYTPWKWARMVLKLYDFHKADAIVAEQNYGGELVRTNIHSHDQTARVRLVWASRGKHVRADPVAGLVSQDKMRHVGQFGKLEDQLLQFATYGYTGDRSPDRADAYIWAATDLVVSNRKKPVRVIY